MKKEVKNYDWKITAFKMLKTAAFIGAAAFVHTLSVNLNMLQGTEVAVYIAILTPILNGLENYLKHKDD